MYKKEYLKNKEEELRKEALEINTIGEQNYLGLLSDQNFYYSLSVIARQQKASIWIVDRFGFITRVADLNQNNGWEGKQFTKEEFYQYLQEVLKGKEIITPVFSEEFENPVITIGRPLIVRNRILGAIFIHTQMEEIEKAYRNLYSQLWKSAILSGILGILLISWTAVHLSTPLIQINAAVNDISKGKFDKRVKVKSKDEIGQLAASFNMMAEDLKNLEELRKGFVANVSHELRSPLTSMQGFIQGMVDGTIPQEEHQQYMQIVLDETKRLTKLINELLDLSQIESGKFPLHMETFDVNELIRRVLIKYEGKIEKKNLDIEVMFREEQFIVEADKDRIEQVISNLLDNAIKFSSPNEKITLWTHGSKDKIYVSIRDSGPGIREEDLPFIWERFYKADKAHTPGETGTGLGLPIVKKIIEQHGQKIWVKSQPDKGAVFVFTLAKAQ